MVDPESGHLKMKKGEGWLNTFTTILTYLMRCNTDVTSLLSGTSIKAVIVYVTDYITKSALKTHTLFEAVCSVFKKTKDTLPVDMDRLQKAHKDRKYPNLSERDRITYGLHVFTQPARSLQEPSHFYLETHM